MSYTLVVRVEVEREDLPQLFAQVAPGDRAATRAELARALAEITADPNRVGSACRYELAGYRRHKFFTTAVRKPGETPRGRMVFRVNQDRRVVTVEAVALRRGNGDSPYFRTRARKG